MALFSESVLSRLTRRKRGVFSLDFFQRSGRHCMSFGTCVPSIEAVSLRCSEAKAWSKRVIEMKSRMGQKMSLFEGVKKKIVLR